MISRNDQITFVIHCNVMCLNLCYKRFRKEKISLEQSNGFLEFRLARSTLLFAPFPVDLWREGGGVGGGGGKHGIAKIGLTPPHPGTHIYSTLCIQEYLIGSQNNWFGLYKLSFSLHDIGKTPI